jgi:hypothetical protein
LFEADDKQSARKILELVFAREIEEHTLVAANFLGLAEIRIASGDTAGALDLLRRLVVAVGNPFENLDPAAALLEKTAHNAEAVEFLDQLVKSAPWDASYRLRLAAAKLAAEKDAASAQEALSAIAAAPNTSYDLRLKAAAALAGRAHGDLGSGELNLLAGDPAVITAAAADKFYFYAARIKAAQNGADAPAKLRLLSHCITDFPRRDEARVPLFQVAAAANSNEYALGVLEPTLQTFQTQLLRNQFAAGGNEEEAIVSSGPEEDESADESNAPALVVPKLSRAQQAQIAQLVGDTMIRVDRLADALAYYDNARRLESSAAMRKILLHKIADANSVLRIQRQNAARQPLLHEPLEQDRVVRPKVVRPQLLAGAVPKAAAAQAGVQPGGVKQ